MKLPIYLDNNATTPVDKRVLARMLPYFTEQFGNASSKAHPFGWAAEEAVEQARAQVASLIGAEAREIVFTGGATESINTAIKGIAEVYVGKGHRIITVQTEHKAVLGACQSLERRGFEITTLPVQPDGLLDLDGLEAALTNETILVAVMWANNETGVLQPIRAIAELVRARGALFMTDATQAVGKIPVDVAPADVLVGSGHKFYAPKGIGFLYARKRRPGVRFMPLIDGGSQEDGLRGGTLNVPGIVALGMAAELAQEEFAADAARLEALRDGFEARLLEALPDIQINGHTAPRLPQTSNITFLGVEAAKLMLAVRDLAVSTGSACSTASPKPSHVLQALGLAEEDIFSSIRFSLGRFTTAEQMDYAAEHLIAAVRKLRGGHKEQVAVNL